MQTTDHSLQPLLETVWAQIKKAELPVHSLLGDQGGEKIFEQYTPPYDAQTLHRMFSITKSFCSLAVGFLLEEKKLRLDDKIVSFFPEYAPEDGFHTYLAAMTISEMLRMETCHTSTTYKFHMDESWVRSFFVTPPSHRSGQLFNYDTSSTHVLAALVQKLSGKDVLTYLRGKCLSSIGFSDAAYIIRNDFQEEIGGSGLMCLPSDLLKTGRFLMNVLCDGASEDELASAFLHGAAPVSGQPLSMEMSLSFAAYLKDAVSYKTPNIHTGQTLEEQQGYGYQFWRVRGGFCMFGMGGQYILFYPQYDLVLVTTADLQNIKGGTQLLLNIIHDALAESAPHWNIYEQNTSMPSAAPYADVFDKHWAVLPKPASCTAREAAESPSAPFSSISLTCDSEGGTLALHAVSDTYTIPFSFKDLAPGLLGKEGRKIVTKAVWISDSVLYLPVYLVGEDVGSIHLVLHISEEGLTISMRKIVEGALDSFSGFWEAR